MLSIRYRRLPVSFVIVILMIVFSGTTNMQELWKAPDWTDTLKNPYPSSWGRRTIVNAALDEGKRLYEARCAVCHGKTGSGDGIPGMAFAVMPANFHDESVKRQSDGALYWKLTEGRGAMPSYRELPDDQRWKLVSYLRQLSETAAINDRSGGANRGLPITAFSIEKSLNSIYFSVPADVTNVRESEALFFMVDTVASGLDLPWSMAFLPDGMVLVTERSGRILRIDGRDQEPQPIRGSIPEELRDIKLHPQFAENQLIYFSYYIEPVGGQGGYTVLMQARLGESGKLSDNKLLYKAGPFNQHGFFYGSKIAFDRDGYLYFTVGISGDRKNAQDLSRPEGKTMRMHADGSIPDDNPFVGDARALPEIYSYGHRMHEGLVYDTYTGDLFSTEFGELGGDELNIIKPGANYGWPEVTFSREYNGAIISRDSLRSDVEAPVRHWTFAPSDLAMIYSEHYPEWEGNILIGGLAPKSLLRVELEGSLYRDDEWLLPNVGRIRDVKLAPDGFLYAMTEDTGHILRLIPVQKNNPTDLD